MQHSRSVIFAIGLTFGFGMSAASAQDLSRYRAYALESNLALVSASSGARPTDVKTLHERPASIQELQWRAPYLGSRDTLVDPVGAIRTRAMEIDAPDTIGVVHECGRTEQQAIDDLEHGGVRADT